MYMNRVKFGQQNSHNFNRVNQNWTTVILSDKEKVVVINYKSFFIGW